MRPYLIDAVGLKPASAIVLNLLLHEVIERFISRI